MQKRILVLGGAHIDRRGRISGATVQGASNPGHWIEEAGGGGFNAARNLARLGHHVTMISPRGGDAAGEMVSEAADFAGVIDKPFVFLDRRTPSYTAILEQDGNLVIALADMDLYQLFSPRRLSIRAVRDAFSDHDIVLMDANLPPETLNIIATRCAALQKPVAAIAISPAKVVRLRQSADRIDYLLMNEAEAAAFVGESAVDPQDWPVLLRKTGLKGGVVTRGMNDLIAYLGSEVVTLRPPRLDAVSDVTGAGDSLAAGFLAAICRGESLAQAVREGAAAAVITVQSPNAVSEDLTLDLLQKTSDLVSEARIVH
ncbi:carbohydrate kinase family protein [Oryzifoliimicrobium ureilyticus]|uniref:carbohydrate kinase family protein n=1 Tax=Oryzifoliimicrobium ureilyticus TaxID=3113724 RepID=UPI003076623B